MVAWLLWGVFVDAQRPLGWVVACAVVALLLHPLVTLCARHLPRALAVVTVLVVIVGLISLLGFAVAREVTESLDELAVEAPRAAAGLERQYRWAVEVGVAERVQGLVGELDERIRDGAVSGAANTLPTYVVTGILMLFFLVGGHRYVNGFLEQLPEPRRSRWRRILVTGVGNARGWLLGSIGIGAVVGVCVGTVSWQADLPAAISMGLIAGLLAITPVVGVVLGGFPAVLLAFGFEGWRTGAAVTGLLVVLQLLDALVVRPALERRTVRVGVTVPVLVALVGFELYRVGGAVYAVAVAVLVLGVLDAAGYRVDGDDGDEDDADDADDEPATVVADEVAGIA